MFHLSYLLKYFFNNLIKCQNIQLTAIRSFHPSFTPQDPPVFAYTTSIRYITVTASKLLWYYTFQNKILSTARKFSIFVCQAHVGNLGHFSAKWCGHCSMLLFTSWSVKAFWKPLLATSSYSIIKCHCLKALQSKGFGQLKGDWKFKLIVYRMATEIQSIWGLHCCHWAPQYPLLFPVTGIPHHLDSWGTKPLEVASGRWHGASGRWGKGT